MMTWVTVPYEPMARLREIEAALRRGEESPIVSVRELLGWFDAQRRGYWIVQEIRRVLNDTTLRTEPDFESAYIDANIGFRLHTSGALNVTEDDDVLVASGGAGKISIDPTFRISKFEAANKPVTSVSPDATLQQVVTVLLEYDFSQVPVMSSPREVRGMITWAGLGSRLALNAIGSRAADFMDRHHEVPADTSFFEAIPTIVTHDYVLVRAKDKSVAGIVTASDLSMQFRSLSEPFLLLSEIENHLRSIINGPFAKEDFVAAKEASDTARTVETVADLSFGEYIRLIENPARWKKLNLRLDRVKFCEKLEKVRSIRNDVMHFDPDGVPPEDLELLRAFVRYFRRVLELSRNAGQPQGLER